MRVLLLDNHDSFTFNLAHYIAQATGVLPDVVSHDDPPVAPELVDNWLGSYDAIVISPGPGTPERASDLGLSRPAITQCHVPVLGICLGMQAIGHDAGIPVVPAPLPVHGEVADIHHDGRGLFHGMNSPVRMVRYHSLIVDSRACEDNDDVVIDARSGDIVMALHRLSRPQWGLQVHPESICSEHGPDVLARFFDLARAWNRAHPRTAAPHSRQPERLAVTPAPTWRVIAHPVPTSATAETIFSAMFRGDDYAWWLDSATGEGVSACGSAAGPLARVATATATGLQVRRGSKTDDSTQDLLDLVALTLGEVHATGLDGRAVAAGDLPFVPSWVGYLGYEYSCRWLPGHDSSAAATDSPPAELVFSDRVVAVAGTEVWVMAVTDDAVDDLQRDWVINTAREISQLPATTPHLPNPPHCGEVSIRHGQNDYLELIGQCQEEISRGESYELCLTNNISTEVRCDSWDLYRRLRALSPRPFAAYLAFGDRHLLSASPERFLRIDAAGEVEAKPIKGTRPRSQDPVEDDRLADELLHSVKERAENLMIVDLLRHDLSRVCNPGSVTVPLLFDVETHSGVHQLVSTIRGELAPGRGPLDAVRSALPGGSMTGAPKERSVSILRRLEAAPRGAYSGVLGYFSLNGTTDLSIIIRTIVHHGDHLEYGVGGAITALSDAGEEWAETMVKARTLGVALGVDIEELLSRP